VAKEGELEVRIIERREVPFPTEEGGIRFEVWTSYRYGRIPPGLVKIPKEQYTPEEERARIKADIQARSAGQPEILRV